MTFRVFNGFSHEHSLKMWLQWQQIIRFQNLAYTRWGQVSSVRKKSFTGCRDIYQKPSVRVKTPSGPHRLKLIIINFILAKQKCRAAFLGLKKCLINCIFYRVAVKKHSWKEHFKNLLSW